LKPLAKEIDGSLPSGFLKKNFITEYLTPLMLAVFNFLIIPLLIDLVAFLEDHWTKSEKQLSIMKKNLFFMTLNTILLPLTGLITIRKFLEESFESF